MYYLPAGSRVKVREIGRGEFRSHTTKRLLVWEHYQESYPGGYVFWYGAWEIAVKREAVQEQLLPRQGPKPIGALIEKLMERYSLEEKT